MKKDFVNWHKKKENIDNKNDRVYFHEREVWWCRIGVNVGYEQDGKGNNFTRPVLIIKGFSKEVFLCVPITTKEKSGKYYYNIDLGDNMQRKIIMSQIRLLDSKRLQEKIITINKGEFMKIKQAIIRLIE
jgi:mRNA interferase MazF